MEKETTKQRILMESLKLFSKEGYEAVSVEQIANAVGIKAPSLYKHYQSKRDIFCSILRVMEQRDRDNAAACLLPEETMELDPQAYEQSSVADLIAFSKMQFRYWTEDAFASAFRQMLTVEQYRSPEMNALYHQYLGAGPLQYTADLLGSMTRALALCGPMHLLYSVYDAAEDKDEVKHMWEEHLRAWMK
jgi:AcrR family transcriptional regulator